MSEDGAGHSRAGQARSQGLSCVLETLPNAVPLKSALPLSGAWLSPEGPGLLHTLLTAPLIPLTQPRGGSHAPHPL